jgi:hypothetical protein
MLSRGFGPQEALATPVKSVGTTQQPGYLDLDGRWTAHLMTVEAYARQGVSNKERTMYLINHPKEKNHPNFTPSQTPPSRY